MKRFLTYFFCIAAALIISGAAAWCQEISVKEFKAENEATAMLAGNVRKDQNGSTCALIRIQTTETGFTFENGILGITDTANKVGEIWVWVPRSTKYITIRHQQLGTLDKYYFPVPIESGFTYTMVLTTAKVKTIVVNEPKKTQFIVFQLNPEDAVVFLDEEMLVTNNGVAKKLVEAGTHEYKVHAPSYISDMGTVNVTDTRNSTVVNVTLDPNFANLTLVSIQGMDIYIDDEKVGTSPWTGRVNSGKHIVQVKNASYRTSTTEIDVTPADNGKTVTLNNPEPIYGSVILTADPEITDVYIDGKKIGQTPLVYNEVLVGSRKFTFRCTGYEDCSVTAEIRRGNNEVEGRLKQKTSTPSYSVATGSSRLSSADIYNGIGYKNTSSTAKRSGNPFIMIGPHLAFSTGSYDTKSSSSSYPKLSEVNIGGELRLGKVQSALFVTAGLDYSLATYQDSKYSSSEKIKYLGIPLTLNYSWGRDSDFCLYVGAGLSFCNFGSDEFDDTYVEVERVTRFLLQTGAAGRHLDFRLFLGFCNDEDFYLPPVNVGLSMTWYL